MARASSAGKRRTALRKTLAVVTAALLCITMGGCAGSSATIDDEPTPLAETAGDTNIDEGGSQNVDEGNDSGNEDDPDNNNGEGEELDEGSDIPEEAGKDESNDGQPANEGESNLVEQGISKIDRIVRLAAEGRIASVSTFEELKAAVDADAELIAVTLAETIKATEPIVVKAGKEINIIGGTLSRTRQTYPIFTVEEGAVLTLENVVLTGINEDDSGSQKYVSALVSKGMLNLTAGTKISGFASLSGGGLTVAGGITTLDNAVIENNAASADWKSIAYGGGIHISAGEVVVKEGQIRGNRALCCDSYSRSTACYGGGIAATGGKVTLGKGAVISENETRCTDHRNREGLDGGGVFVGRNADFVFDGGIISGNIAQHSGGGICVSIDRQPNNDRVHLVSGEITGNTADTGGGVYLATGSAIQIVSTLISENIADDGTHYTGMGGGLWSCGYGQTYATSTGSCLVTGNSAVKRGSDLTLEPSYYNGVVHQFPNYLTDGTKISWSQIKYDKTSNQGWIKEDLGTDPLVDINAYISDWFDENAPYGNDLALKASNSFKSEDYTLHITRNTAKTYGGGIAYNGLLVMGEDKDISLTVNKAWEGVDEAAQPESIRVDLYKGDKSIDTLELTKENGWTYTVNGLPEGDDYRVEEQKIDGFSATYSEVSLVDAEKRAYEVTITNKSAGGDLRITKAWADTAAEDMAKNGTATAIFRVTGYATQAEAEAGEGTEIYRNLVALTFNDPTTQERVLTGLPLGFYVVQEIGYEGDNLDDDTVAANRTVVEVSATDADPAEASFTNRHSNEHVFGTSVVNTYEASPNNGIVFRNQDPLYRELHGTVA